MTLQEYIDQVRGVLDEYKTDISFWTDKELTHWLNEGLKEVSKITKYSTDKEIYDPTDETEYSLPNDFIDYYRVKIDGDFVDSISIDEDGEEEGFYIWGEKLYLSNVDTDSKLTLFYYNMVPKMANMLDEADIPVQYEEIIIPFCLYRAFMKDQKSDMAQLNQTEFYERVKVMKRKFNREPNYTSWKVIR
jgi:hypothetical protein